MYRSAAVFLIILFSTSVFSADSRTERWNIRIDRLKKIQGEASAGKFDKTFVDKITASEIKSCEEFLSLLDRYRKEDGSLKSDTKKYSLTDIEKKVKEISSPAISLNYMSELFKAAGDTQAKERISSEITQYSAKKFGSAIRITSAEGISMAEQYILERGMAEFDSSLNNTMTDLLSKIQYELSRSDYNSNEADLGRMILKHIEETLSTVKFSENNSFNEKYLLNIPQWKFMEEQFSKIEARNKSIWNFVYKGKSPLNSTENIKDKNSAEEEIFSKAKEKISDMLQNTTPSSGAMGNNPYYEIPDVKRLGITLDEIDKYRNNLAQNISGSEDKELAEKLKGNNTGIAARGINRIDAQFKSEEARIERLKKMKGDIIIYNEEVFKASRNHFYEIRTEIYKYTALSEEFLEALYSSGKTDPQKYIDLHRYRSDRYISYISFSEKLTANTLTLPVTGSEKLHSLYKGTIPKVLASAKSFLKPEAIPAETRAALHREHLKEYAAINADFRTKGSMLINAVRKNYDECNTGFAEISASKKESSINSEVQIGQDETDRLFSFAKKCSDALASMNYTESVLNKYKEEYNRVSEELKKGNKTAGFPGGDASAPFFESIPGFDAAAIDKETATRELLAGEGMEALSGSITLVQYYKRRGFPVKFSPANEEIIIMKQNFTRTPEVIVSAWKMNGKNFRQIDINITAELKKMQNKNAWNSKVNETPKEVLTVDETGINVSFNPPPGWKKIPDPENDHFRKIIFESPDMKGTIELTSICEDEKNLQVLVSLWPEKWGFSMTEKTWGKIKNSDYIKSTAKNRYDGVMESYMVAKNGHVIILSGKTTGDMYRQLNRTLADIFNNMEITGSAI
ncbi:MAG TPA: hypothetical protein PKG60_08815 [Spirochaetota bacterium]|nr:hypothetical protein [Spirochaetota bacterium]HPS86183.1 hypothetical protein [Spirochaetota bacterium]